VVSFKSIFYVNYFVATANGAAVGTYNHLAIDMVNNGHNLATVGGLGSNQETFKDTWWACN
jgi:hypothetical protein